mmetsp:Transcript_60079/g.173239  ORF Transcript_60079/g.173239 Transcript_60079/m.173239 type:complete len:305 (+) Transcript_60079:429-1343(+)
MHTEDRGGSRSLVVFDRIGPQQVPEPLVRILLQVGVSQGPLDLPQCVDRPLAVADAAVHHEDLLLHQARQGQHDEGVAQKRKNVRPMLVAEARENRSLEAVLDVHLHVLMVPAIQEDVVWIGDLEREENNKDLDLVLPAVNKVAVEDDRGTLWCTRKPELPPEQHQVAELPVQVAEDLARRLDILQGRALGEDSSCRRNQKPGSVADLCMALSAQQLAQQALGLPILIIRVVLGLYDVLHQRLGVLDDLLRQLQGSLILLARGAQAQAPRGSSAALLPCLSLVEDMGRKRQHIRLFGVRVVVVE